MNKWLLLVLGIISILLLSYLSFKQKATIIQKDLLEKADTLHQNPAFKDVYIKLKGEGFTLTRELILLGDVSSKEEKNLASQILQKIDGITKVNNHLKVQKLKPIIKEVERVEEEQKEKIDTIKVTNEENNISDLNSTQLILKKESNLSTIETNENNTTELNSTKQQLVENPESNMTKENNESNQSSNCQKQLNDILTKSKIQFAHNSSNIQKSSYKQLDQIRNILKECNTTLIIIDGYTDNSGNANYNKLLSKKRANRVKEYLVSKGIKKESIKAFGHGAENPIASNATKEGREKNRRIEFTIKRIQ